MRTLHKKAKASFQCTYYSLSFILLLLSKSFGSCVRGPMLPDILELVVNFL